MKLIKLFEEFIPASQVFQTPNLGVLKTPKSSKPQIVAAVTPAVAASGAPPRDEVVEDCIGNIYGEILYNPNTVKTILAGAKRIERAGITPTEEELAAAQKKFLDDLLKSFQKWGKEVDALRKE